MAGQAKGARDLELPPWAKGRYGTAIGRAVHGVLQAIDLATGEGLGDAVSAAAIPAREAFYRPQVNAYRSALGDSTGAITSDQLVLLAPRESQLE